MATDIDQPTLDWLFDEGSLTRRLTRLAHEIVERNGGTDGLVLADGDPAEIVAGRESVRLAFVAAVQAGAEE